MSTENIFEEKKYLFLKNFLHIDVCNSLVNQFEILIAQGETKVDDQCPLSHSVGHIALFDSLLEQLTPHMEKATGKKLYPTYAYARWYAPGDELKIHKDRPSCEVSATITLGLKGSSWPIYVGFNNDKSNFTKIDMDVGDAVIYKGCELLHWREKYVEGEWQVQVFLHYVDAEGSFAEYKYDKRKNLAHHTLEEPQVFRVFPNAFTKKACQNIIEKYEANIDFFEPAQIQGGHVNPEVRKTDKCPIEVLSPLSCSLIGYAYYANSYVWNFDISNGVQQTEYLRYDQTGKFNTHVDSFLTYVGATETRKLTTILILNDDFEGGKLYIGQENSRIYPRQNAGDVIVFPSFCTHGVEPITKGIRRSIVNWVLGPYFK